MTEKEIKIKLSYAKEDVKKYERLLQKDTIHCYSKRQENKEQFMKYVREKSDKPYFIKHYEKLLDEYLELAIYKDKYNLYRTSQYSMNGNWDKKPKMFKKPFFEILKRCVDSNILPKFYMSDDSYMIEES